MTEVATLTLTYLAWLAFIAKRLLTYMHAFQQEEYDDGRFLKWIAQNKVFDKRLSFILLIIGGIWFVAPPFVVGFALFASLILTAYREKDPRKHAKKKLALTNRVKRTLIPAFIVLAILGAPCVFIMPWSWIIPIQLLPIILVLSNIFLMRTENKIQEKFLQEAKNKIFELQPKVIAITGSFGKTSVKHILGHILKAQASTLITPGSVNTPMGITRVIREDLNDRHKFFIVEMGAYGPGSIARLCDLTPPMMGIITTIGHAHFERFGSLETVAQTKFELAEATLENKGKVIIHERTLRFDYARNIKNAHKKSFTVCGQPPEFNIHKKKDEQYLTDDDIGIREVAQTDSGLEINLIWEEEIYHLRAPVYGLHHGHNIALAFAAAMELGIPAEDIQTALMSLPQIPHRLEVKTQANGTTIIDDAYNSNPVGFTSALDLLYTLGKEGRKIIVTPGMVELGSAHDQAHHQAGKQAGKICDIAIVVQPQRIPTFVEGFERTGKDKVLIAVNSFEEASRILMENRQSGDIILLENDLPDIYERIPKI